MREIAILVRLNLYWIIAIPFLIAVACSDLSDFEKHQVEQALGDSLLNSTESWGFSMDLLEDQALRMNMTGSYSYNIQRNGENITRITGPVHIKIFDENRQLESEVHCDSAIYEPEKEVFEMFKNVEVITHDGRILRSKHLVWHRKIDKVSTPEFVTFITASDSITAYGFDGNTDLTEYTLNQASGNFVTE